MIEPFWGEFLISPIPLELSLNYCSHKCAYCFANLNQPDRKADVKKIMRFLQDFTSRNTLEAELLRQGYPVCVSNRTDPFAVSNYRQMLPIMRVMTEMGIPLQIQTKGGVGITEALDFLPPSVWYISISMLDDEIRRKIEPGAPAVESRFNLIELVRDKGHRVVVGLNPCVPEWLPDPHLLLERAAKAGAEAAWIEELHLSAKQEGNLSPGERAALGEDLIARARKRRRDAIDSEAFFRARDDAIDAGLHVFSNGQPYYSRIWDIYRETYPKVFTTNQDFVNLCYDTSLDWHLIPFGVWADFVGDGLPEGKFRMSKYLGASAMSIWETHNVPSKLSYRELLGIIWQMQRAKQSPVRMPSFAYAALQAENGWVQLIDANEQPYLVFDRADQFKSYFTAVQVDFHQEV